MLLKLKFFFKSTYGLNAMPPTAQIISVDTFRRWSKTDSIIFNENKDFGIAQMIIKIRAKLEDL